MTGTFFVVGCARSGTTAYARALNTADNAEVHVEQAPRLRVLSRKLLDGMNVPPAQVVRDSKQQAVSSAHTAGRSYGDKNPCYLPFIPALVEVFDATIIWLTRDGRAVVRSLMDWHALHAHNIYARAEDGVTGGTIQPEDDPWDYSRPRPRQGEVDYELWPSMSRFEKCAWYWSRFNELALEHWNFLPTGRMIRVPVSSEDSLKHIEGLFANLGLTGFDEDKIRPLIESRLNSVVHRRGVPDEFPAPSQWPPSLQREFERAAGAMMVRLGYSDHVDLSAR